MTLAVRATGHGRAPASKTEPRKHVGGVVYSPHKARRQLRAATHLRVGAGAGVYLAAVLDLLTQDALLLGQALTLAGSGLLTERGYPVKQDET
jgi:hypothetical protein